MQEKFFLGSFLAVQTYTSLTLSKMAGNLKVSETDPVFMEYALKRSLISRNKLAIILKGKNGVNFCCVECPARFREKEKLELHLFTHNKEYRYICEICGTGLKRKEHLDRHKLGHQEVRPYVCTICGKGFKRKEHLTIHRTIHTGDKTQVCTFCNRSFNRKDHLQKHIQTHSKEFYNKNMSASDVQDMVEIKQEPMNATTEDEDIDYSELGENIEFDSEEQDPLEFHASTSQESEDTRPYACQVCPKTFKKKQHLNMHAWTHMKKDKICPTCGKGFQMEVQLFAHMTDCKQLEQIEISIDTETVYEVEEPPVEEDKIDRNAARPYVCKVCSKSFKRKDHLKIHTWTHMKKDKICPTCGEAFQMDVLLFAHMTTCKQTQLDSSLDTDVEESSENQPAEVKTEDALTDRPHVCNICFKSYKRKDHLKIHSWTHMKKDKICTACGKAFHINEQLNWHMSVCMSVHLNKTSDLDVSCDNSLLVERRSVNVPVEVSRPYPCAICGRRFKRKQHLNVHANVHLKKIPTQLTVWCPSCNEGFVCNEDFEAHQCRSAEGSKDVADEDTAASPRFEAKKENSNPSEFLELEMIEDEAIIDEAYEAARAHSLAEQELPVPQRVYVCKYCGKPFKRKDHYNIHLHIHTGVKSFFCNECGKGFYRKDHLQKHEQIHAKPKVKSKKQLPELFPISKLPKKMDALPEITIRAPSNSKLRVPLQIKVPYQMVVSSPGGARTLTVHPPASAPATPPAPASPPAGPSAVYT